MRGSGLEPCERSLRVERHLETGALLGGQAGGHLDEEAAALPDVGIRVVLAVDEQDPGVLQRRFERAPYRLGWHVLRPVQRARDEAPQRLAPPKEAGHSRLPGLHGHPVHPAELDQPGQDADGSLAFGHLGGHAESHDGSRAVPDRRDPVHADCLHAEARHCYRLVQSLVPQDGLEQATGAVPDPAVVHANGRQSALGQAPGDPRP